MVAPAPGRFSMITGCFSAVDKCCPTRRPTTSTGEPGVSGTTILIGFDGYVWAWTGVERPSPIIAAKVIASLRITLISSADGWRISIDLQSGSFPPLDPFRCFLAEKRGEILWRTAERIAAELAQGEFHVIRLERIVDGAIEFGDDLRRGARRARHAGP